MLVDLRKNVVLQYCTDAQSMSVCDPGPRRLIRQNTDERRLR
jgi:hypothetical protein